MSIFRFSVFVKIRRELASRLSTLNEKLKLPEKYKTGRIKKYAEFWQSLYIDYRAVAKETFEESKARPLKTSIILGAIGISVYAIKTNPDERCFRNQLLASTNDIVLLDTSIRNPQAEEHLRFLHSCCNEGLLRRLNLVLLSLMWVDNYHPDCQMYHSQCSYLKPRYLTFYQRIIDIGVFGQWIGLNRKMEDYDINPNEWENHKSVE